MHPGPSIPPVRSSAAHRPESVRERVTVAILYPGHAAEHDYPLAEQLLGDGVRLPVVHTSLDVDAHRIDALLDLGNESRLADGAAHAAAYRPDAVVWACTSGSFVFGWDGAHAQIRALGGAAGVPASSTSLAFVDAIRALGIERVAIAATYPEDVAASFRDFLGAAGVEVQRVSSAGIVTAAEVGTLDRSAVLELACANDHPSAQAVLVPDTALHSLAVLPDLEERLGKPVLTANQVTVWHGLRLAGHFPRHDALGALFAAPAEIAVS